MDIVTYKKAVKKAKQMIDEHIRDLPVATEETLGAVKVGDGLSITQDGKLSVHCADSAEEGNLLPISSSAVDTEVEKINKKLAAVFDDFGMIIDIIKSTVDYVYIVHGTYSGETGRSDRGAVDIYAAVIGGAVPLGDFLLDESVLNGYEAHHHVFLILTEDDTGAVRLGAYASYDTEHQKARFVAAGIPSGVTIDANHIIRIE